MITIRDSVEINASPKNIFEWFAHLDTNWKSWHPEDHVECRYLKGSPIEKGSILYMEAYILGKSQNGKFHVTNVVPNSRIEFKWGFPLSLFGAGGAFIIEPKGANSLFINDNYIGIKIPLLGSIIDKFTQILLGRRFIGALKKHMVEEGQILKRIMEEGV